MRVIAAMSGGVDSSVTALLLQQQGYEVTGVTLKLYDGAESAGPEKSCCSPSDAGDAAAVSSRLGIPHETLPFQEEFRRQVMERFVREYEAGRTPNPCIDCNRMIKFRLLLQRAQELHYDAVATGHYARVSYEGGRWLLKKGLDRDKDQSYVLYALTQDQLAHLLLPLGELTKPVVRSLAERAGFANAHRHDSQDICFIPDGDYGSFLERFSGKTYPEGDFLDLSGKKLGTHRGAVRYTLGQRKGLGLAMGEPVYVCAKDMAANTVTVGPEAALYTRGLIAEDFNWVAWDVPPARFRCTAQTRYHQREKTVFVTPGADGTVRIEFDGSQRAVTPGQAVVLYAGDLLLGGGTVRSVFF